MPQTPSDVFSRLPACRVLPVITPGEVDETLELIAALYRGRYARHRNHAAQ